MGEIFLVITLWVGQPRVSMESWVPMTNIALCTTVMKQMQISHAVQTDVEFRCVSRPTDEGGFTKT